MKAILSIMAHILRDQRRAFLKGALLSLLVLLMGAALLGLSGWFITAAAAAGLAGAGAVFDVFRPSAMVRFLALGRTAARYGERLLTHDATLRALTGIRVSLLRGLARQRFEQLGKLRAAQSLNRVVADVDALDGISLRLLLPLVAGAVTLLLALAVVGWLVDWGLALLLLAVFAAGAGGILAVGLRKAAAPSRQAETLDQGLRSATIDLVSARRDLAVYGQLTAVLGDLRQGETRRVAALRRLDRIERRAGAGLSLVAALAVALAVGLGGDMALTGRVEPASLALAIFVALALVETLAPLRRALTDTGRILQAAQRVAPVLAAPRMDPRGGDSADGGVLGLHDIFFQRSGAALPVLSGINVDLRPGDCVALTGASGSGKSTLLQIAAGLLEPTSGEVRIGLTPVRSLSDTALRRLVTYVPQRTALMAGSVAQNLRVAAPDATDAELNAVLAACQLDHVLHPRGGLAMRLGPRGSGLSGGEMRRLVLARALLRRPDFLLLDEPTEGLDPETATRVMAGIRAYMPGAAILLAAHRPEERAFADREIRLSRHGDAGLKDKFSI